MKEIFKLTLCGIIAILFVMLISPFIKIMGFILSFLIGVWITYGVMTWLAEKYKWNW